MVRSSTIAANARGTRFSLFPQLPGPDGQGERETVWISATAGGIGPGPSDDRMYLVDPAGKEKPYGYYDDGGFLHHYRPPWEGAVHPPAMPDADGHFDHLSVGTPQFLQAHAYGSVRFALNIWEAYFGRAIQWHFSADYDRLEILFLPSLDNAYAGYGSIELGVYPLKSGVKVPFALSFDVVAHELGHLIIYSEVGLPATTDVHGEFFGFHESAADMVSLIALMHFKSALSGLLEATSGNLYTYNRLNRFGEISDAGQLRMASNARTLFEFVDGWKKEHELAQPLTGALFDIWVDVFHEILLERALIPGELEDLSDRLEQDPGYDQIIQPLFDQAYTQNRQGFAHALAQARDYMGQALAGTWKRLTPAGLDYADVFEALMAADTDLSGGRFHRIITVNMTRRGIGIVRAGARITPPDGDSHAFSVRTAVPGDDQPPVNCCRLPYLQRMALARGGPDMSRTRAGVRRTSAFR